jgi:uncharacterized protein
MTIQSRNVTFELEDELSQDWVAGNPVATAFFNAMSMTFPLGEKMFVDSVRHYIDDLEDPALVAEARGFCAQEGVHRREHRRYNETLCKVRGYDLARMEDPFAKNLQFARKHLSPLQQLAGTAAIEHITAIMGESVLKDGTVFEDATPTLSKLWKWHGAEELEHKSVAFDVFKAVGGTEKMLHVAMRRAMFMVLKNIIRMMLYMLRHNSTRTRLRDWREAWDILFARTGLSADIRLRYREWFVPGYHPAQHDTTDLLAAWEASYSEAAA